MSPTNKKIKVIVITVPKSNRVDRLEQILRTSSNLEIQKFEAIMYNRQMKNYKPNFTKQFALYGRQLSDGEIGCAISHQLVQSGFEDEIHPIVVLEDDARVARIEEFESMINKFIHEYGATNAVLSLLPWDHTCTNPQEANTDHKIRRLIGKSPLTVGYVITPSARRAISKANFDFSYLPDWPPTETQFYIAKSGVITHGDSSTESLIDKTGRKKATRRGAAYRFSFIPYLLNRSQFANVKEYFEFAIKQAITWRIDRMRIQ